MERVRILLGVERFSSVIEYDESLRSWGLCSRIDPLDLQCRLGCRYPSGSELKRQVWGMRNGLTYSPSFSQECHQLYLPEGLTRNPTTGNHMFPE